MKDVSSIYHISASYTLTASLYLILEPLKQIQFAINDSDFHLQWRESRARLTDKAALLLCVCLCDAIDHMHRAHRKRWFVDADERKEKQHTVASGVKPSSILRNEISTRHRTESLIRNSNKFHYIASPLVAAGGGEFRKTSNKYFGEMFSVFKLFLSAEKSIAISNSSTRGERARHSFELTKISASREIGWIVENVNFSPSSLSGEWVKERRKHQIRKKNLNFK